MEDEGFNALVHLLILKARNEALTVEKEAANKAKAEELLKDASKLKGLHQEVEAEQKKLKELSLTLRPRGM